CPRCGASRQRSPRDRTARLAPSPRHAPTAPPPRPNGPPGCCRPPALAPLPDSWTASEARLRRPDTRYPAAPARLALRRARRARSEQPGVGIRVSHLALLEARRRLGVVRLALAGDAGRVRRGVARHAPARRTRALRGDRAARLRHDLPAALPGAARDARRAAARPGDLDPRDAPPRRAGSREVGGSDRVALGRGARLVLGELGRVRLLL